ncbi:hypothetical protein [Stutzerimonas nitrititolerans]|uniref:hypothetical protein n=1 Tax=Stutzerimonas nitrititolerans TaxID=2482751 RepID=UPI0028A8BCD2|nr:hypothetical protein [Stutzerimonas nitrititolerans]
MNVKFAAAISIPLSLLLSGCGKSWDGRYEADGFRPGESILEIKGNTAIRSMYKYGQLMTSREFNVEQKSDKVIFTAKAGEKTSYVFALAEDDRGLKCISDSCNRFGSLLSKGWNRVDN